METLPLQVSSSHHNSSSSSSPLSDGLLRSTYELTRALAPGSTTRIFFPPLSPPSSPASPPLAPLLLFLLFLSLCFSAVCCGGGESRGGVVSWSRADVMSWRSRERLKLWLARSQAARIIHVIGRANSYGTHVPLHSLLGAINATRTAVSSSIPAC